MVFIVRGGQLTTNSDESEEPSVLISLNNDTFTMEGFQNKPETTYLLHFKQPYCHDCLPEVVRKLVKVNRVKKSLFIIEATKSPLAHKIGYDVLEQKGVKFPRNHYLRTNGDASLTSHWRGYLYLEIFKNGVLIETWSYDQLIKKKLKKHK